MTHSIKSAVTRDGYAFLQAHEPGHGIAGVALALGVPLEPWDDGLVQALVPRATAAPNTYSGIYGLGRFPYHTDLAHWPRPPRFLLLRCMTGYADVPTLMVDGRALVADVSADILGRAVFKPRRPRAGKLHLMRLYEPTDEGHRLRWDELFVKPASEVGDIAAERVKTWLAQAKPASAALERPGDTLIIDNWRMLHARSPILEGREGRRIERIYLEALH